MVLVPRCCSRPLLVRYLASLQAPWEFSSKAFTRRCGIHVCKCLGNRARHFQIPHQARSRPALAPPLVVVVVAACKAAAGVHDGIRRRIARVHRALSASMFAALARVFCRMLRAVRVSRVWRPQPSWRKRTGAARARDLAGVGVGLPCRRGGPAALRRPRPVALRGRAARRAVAEGTSPSGGEAARAQHGAARSPAAPGGRLGVL